MQGAEDQAALTVGVTRLSEPDGHAQAIHWAKAHDRHLTADAFASGTATISSSTFVFFCLLNVINGVIFQSYYKEILIVKDNDTVIFKRVVMSSVGAMEGLARRMLTDEDDVRDVLQEALTRLWVHRTKLLSTSTPHSYCLATLRNVALDYIHMSRPHETLDSIMLTDSADAGDDLDETNVALTQLSDTQRRAIMLRAYGLEVDEIADKMNMTSANVRQLLSRGRRNLKEKLKSLRNERVKPTHT